MTQPYKKINVSKGWIKNDGHIFLSNKTSDVSKDTVPPLPLLNVLDISTVFFSNLKTAMQ